MHMDHNADQTLEDFKRLPGLYRRWELNDICKANCNYHIEDAGTHADGTPLLAIYVSYGQVEDGPAEDDTDPGAYSIEPRTMIPPGIMPPELVSALPLIIEVERTGTEEPSLLSLFGPNGATLADLYIAVMDQRDALAGATRTERALAILLDRLIGQGAAADAFVGATLKEIASGKDREHRQ